jgi:hypothetical protein
MKVHGNPRQGDYFQSLMHAYLGYARELEIDQRLLRQEARGRMKAAAFVTHWLGVMRLRKRLDETVNHCTRDAQGYCRTKLFVCTLRLVSAIIVCCMMWLVKA